MKTTFLPALFLLLWLPSGLPADEYEAAQSIRERTRGKVTGLRVQATWPEDGRTLIYALQPAPMSGPGRWQVDLENGSRQPVAETSDEHVLEWHAPGTCRSGSGAEETEIQFVNESDRVIELHWVQGGRTRQSYGTLEPGEIRPQHTFTGHAWLITGANQHPIACLVAGSSPGTARITEELCTNPPKPDEAPRRSRRGGGNRKSPDGRWEIRFHDHNVFLDSTDGADPIALTEDGAAEDGYRGPASWSPDSRHVVFTRRRNPVVRQVTMIASSPDDQLQPSIETYAYQKPGDEIARDTPILIRVSDQTRIHIDDGLFSNPWSLRAFHWSPDAEEFYVEYNQRGHQVYRVLGVTVTHGAVRTVIEERSDTFIDYSNKIDGRHLDASDEILWMSERDGWNHLYVIDRSTGTARQLTSGPWVVRAIDRVDEEAGTVWFRLMGFDPDQDPYHVHHARINLDGTGFVRLTHGDGTHALAYAPDQQHYIDTWSRVDQPPVHELRRGRDGSLVRELGRADDQPLRDTGWIAPEPFAAKGRDGESDIWGVIYRPTSLDPSAAYPVIESIYAGPHGQHVPKRFASFRDAQALAELGFIVVQIDGMGTNWRSKAFHDVAWKNLKDAGFPDRIAWIRAAAEQYPYLDQSRVGIYGGSAGGQNAMRAVLDYPDFYRAAAADCGCHDNRMDKIWWNEAWMGWPVDESYEASSNVVDAHKLGGALLLTVGELDRNVDPASTMQVVDALIKADKDFELIVFPGKGHGAGGSPYGKRRRYDFFTRHLAPGATFPSK